VVSALLCCEHVSFGPATATVAEAGVQTEFSEDDGSGLTFSHASILSSATKARTLLAELCRSGPHPRSSQRQCEAIAANCRKIAILLSTCREHLDFHVRGPVEAVLEPLRSRIGGPTKSRTLMFEDVAHPVGRRYKERCFAIQRVANALEEQLLVEHAGEINDSGSFLQFPRFLVEEFRRNERSSSRAMLNSHVRFLLAEVAAFSSLGHPKYVPKPLPDIFSRFF